MHIHWITATCNVMLRVIPVQTNVLFSSVGNIPTCMPPGDYSFGSHIRVVDWGRRAWPRAGFMCVSSFCGVKCVNETFCRNIGNEWCFCVCE
jgi:hypothetical protein